MTRPLLLELFSGTGSVGKEFAGKGWDVLSVDNDRRTPASVLLDVGTINDENMLEALNLTKLPTVIWASPPCTNYSIVRALNPPTAEQLEYSDSLVRKTLQIAETLSNKAGKAIPLFVENPFTGKLKRRALLDHLKMQVVDYCKYGYSYRKRTSIWTNTDWIPSRPLCKYDCGSVEDSDLGRKRHVDRVVSSGKAYREKKEKMPPSRVVKHFSRSQRNSMPPELCNEIAEYCDRNYKHNIDE